MYARHRRLRHRLLLARLPPRLPRDYLKIDRSFIAELAGQPPSTATMVRSIIDLGHNLDLIVVAEGIEKPTNSTTPRRRLQQRPGLPVRTPHATQPNPRTPHQIQTSPDKRLNGTPPATDVATIPRRQRRYEHTAAPDVDPAIRATSGPRTVGSRIASREHRRHHTASQLALLNPPRPHARGIRPWASRCGDARVVPRTAGRNISAEVLA